MLCFSAPHTRRRSRGFNLIEVLLAASLAALVLGVILRSVSSCLVGIRESPIRYQLLATAAEILERHLGDENVGESSLEDGLDEEKEEEERQEFEYTVETSVVTADPRVEQVKVTVVGEDGIRVSLSAYRLRIRRAAEQAPEESEEAPPPEEGGSPEEGAPPGEGGEE
ncbi:MAG: hypothetical protein HY319_23895 [Armatimonadetes bacterium]|nr:hypothetical protein [Armatimonadota bacterium]